jgi:hypothetical protein
MRAVSNATWTSGDPVSLAARALALTTSALIEVAIMVFSLYFVLDPKDSNEVIDLRHPLEKPMACALQIAKQPDYSPNQRPYPQATTPHRKPSQFNRGQLIGVRTQLKSFVATAVSPINGA